MKPGDQATAIVLGLDGFAVPMPPQYEAAAWENVVIISSEMTSEGHDRPRIWHPILETTISERFNYGLKPAARNVARSSDGIW
jgi:hypothetical protein